MFSVKSATSQSSSYPIVLTSLGGPRYTFKIVEVPRVEHATSWSKMKHADPRSTNKIL